MDDDVNARTGPDPWRDWETQTSAVGPAPFRITRASLRESTKIPPREWLYGVIMLRKYVTVLVAPGGVGKTALTVVMALALASGRKLLGDAVHAQCNVLLCCLEDPEDEMDRRIAAAMIRHDLDDADLAGRVFHVNGRTRRLVIAAPYVGGGEIVYPDKDALIEQITQHQIGAVFVDPFVNSHELDENDNPQINAAIRAWAEIGETTGCAIFLVHHTRKGAIAGDMDSGRGASALVAACRVGLTLTAMSHEEAAKYGILEADRRTYIRMDDGKANLAPPSDRARWFHLASVPLHNGTPDYPNGDNVQAVEEWIPPSIFEAQTPQALNAALDQIAAGPAPGIMYAPTQRGDNGRWVGQVLVDLLGVPEGQAKSMIASWIKSGLLEITEFRHPDLRKDRPGVRVINSLRPTL